MKLITEEYSRYKVCPAPIDVFKAFLLTDPDTIRVVIIGQDPYPFGNHADGLAFSSSQSETPASLRLIIREVDRDTVKTKDYSEFKRYFPNNSLVPWAKQGVFLINTALTVRAGLPNSHAEFGWKEFISQVLKLLYEKNTPPKVFMSWGSEAQMLTNQLKTSKPSSHIILEAGHPASGAHGKDKFSGCNHFSKTNYFFRKHNLPEINWALNGETIQNL